MEKNDVVEENLAETKSDEKNSYFKLLSWNIDGLDMANLESRTLGVANKILNEKPDVVFLQELVNETEQILRSKLSKQYKFITGKSPVCNYYVAILLNISTCKPKSEKLIQFRNTSMGRCLLQTKFTYKKKVELCVMTAHLESTTEFSAQRCAQLKFCFDEMLKIDQNCLVFFGGDLNLRDSELSSIGGAPAQIYDVWESTGARKECLYTWDTMRNTNLKMNGKFKPRCRFDRLYYRHVKPDPKNYSTTMNSNSNSDEFFTLMPLYFELEGLERLKSCNRFCSDHWAIQTYCQLEAHPVI